MFFALPAGWTLRPIAFDLLTQALHQLAQAQHGIQTPLVPVEEAFFDAHAARLGGL
jgi:hypothetical protein